MPPVYRLSKESGTKEAFQLFFCLRSGFILYNILHIKLTATSDIDRDLCSYLTCRTLIHITFFDREKKKRVSG